MAPQVRTEGYSAEVALSDRACRVTLVTLVVIVALTMALGLKGHGPTPVTGPYRVYVPVVIGGH